MNESLILADAEAQDSQLFLFHAGDLMKIQVDRSKPQFHCTGERLFRDRPEIYRLCKDMIAEEIPDRQIERACHVSHHTLDSIRAREAVPIGEHKKAALHTAARVNHMLIDRIEELAPTMKATEATLAYGITFDKVAVGSGDPTQRIELAPKIDFRELMTKLNQELDSKLDEMKRAKAIEVESRNSKVENSAAAQPKELVEVTRPEIGTLKPEMETAG